MFSTISIKEIQLYLCYRFICNIWTLNYGRIKFDITCFLRRKISNREMARVSLNHVDGDSALSDIHETSNKSLNILRICWETADAYLSS